MFKKLITGILIPNTVYEEIYFSSTKQRQTQKNDTIVWKFISKNVYFKTTAAQKLYTKKEFKNNR